MRAWTSTRINFKQRQIIYFKVLDSLNSLAGSKEQTVYNLLFIDRWTNRAHKLNTKIVPKVLL